MPLYRRFSAPCFKKFDFFSFSWAITEKYPTIRTLSTAYEECNSDAEKENLLAGLPYEENTKKVPLSVSKIICFMFNDDELN